jgi:DNA-binding protein HU-beta
MNQSELIEKVAQATELNQAAASQAVKAVVNAIFDGLLAGEAVRVSGLGIFNVAARPARQGRNPQTGETIEIAASQAVRFHAGKVVKDALNPPNAKAAPRKKTTPVLAISRDNYKILIRSISVTLCGRYSTEHFRTTDIRISTGARDFAQNEVRSIVQYRHGGTRLGEVSARLQFVLDLGLDLFRGEARRRDIADHQHPKRPVILNRVLAVQLIGAEHPDFQPISWSEVI